MSVRLPSSAIVLSVLALVGPGVVRCEARVTPESTGLAAGPTDLTRPLSSAEADDPPGLLDRASLDALVRSLRDADVIGLGEAHDNPTHHAIQAQVLRRLVAEGVRPIVAFEMLSEDQQPAVDEAMIEARPQDELDRRFRWTASGWPDFAAYYPLFVVAQEHGLPVLAADLDASIRRTLARVGRGALSDDERARVVSQLPPDPGREATLRESLQTAHCGVLSGDVLDRLTDAWHARNVVMARRVARAVAPGRPVVLITGRAHLELAAVPGQVAAIRPGTRTRVLDLVEQSVSAPLPNASAVWTTPSLSRPDRCDELRRNPPK